MFVRNLPYTCTDAGLEAAFGEIGPVKESFIVAEKGPGGQSKGFGFVQFALAEDAAAAVAKSKQFKVDGRPVTIDVAKQKPSARGGDRGGEKQAPGEKSGGGGGGDADPRRAGDDGAESDSDAPKTKASDAARPTAPPVSSPGLPAGGAGLGALRARRKRGGEDDADAIHPALKPSRAARSVAIAGLRLAGEPEGINPEAALEAARACGKVEEVLSPAPKLVVDAAKLRHDGATRGVVVVVYASDSIARGAVAALHRSMPGVGKRKQQKVRGRLKDGAAGDGPGSNPGGPGGAGAAPAAPASVLWARQLGGCEGAKPKRWRVIIRNLAFKATDEDIMAACSHAGFVWDLAVPRDFHRKPKGFAFAAYTAEADAERAVREVNGVSVAGRQVAVDWALSKHAYAEAKAKAEADAEAAEAGDDEEDGSETDGSGSDGSGSDDSDAGTEDSGDADDAAAADSSASSGDEDDAENADRRLDGPAKPNTSGEDDDSMLRRVMLRVMEHPDAAENPAETRDASLARRGATRREAREAQREAKVEVKRKLTEARDEAKRERARRVAEDVVSDDDEPPPLPGVKAKRTTPPEAGASVFLRDVPTEVTKQEVYERMRAFGAVRSCRLVVDKATGRPKGTAFVDFHEPRSAAAAVAAAEKEEGGGVKLAGRRLAVALAVSASEAASLAEKRSKESLVGGRAKRDGPRDNRNLYLASEGQVHEEGPAARGVSQTDIQKRRRAKEEQAMKLKNPNFFISKTRLQVRNVPPEMDQKQLKRVFFDAVKQRATRANPRVTHAKLLFDPTRPDENGKPRSRGIGFVEFAEHEHALAALRALNNNPTTFTSQRRPIVEFAVEDARAVRKLERRREGLDKAQRERDAEKAARGEAAADDPAGTKKKTRGQKRREREREGDAGAAKKPWGNKKKKTPSSSKAGDAAANGGEGDERTPGDGGRRGGATTPATTSATTRREPARVPPRKPPFETHEKRLPSASDAAPARVAKRTKRAERRDATDDLLDRHVAKARRASDARGAKPAKALARWFDY